MPPTSPTVARLLQAATRPPARRPRAASGTAERTDVYFSAFGPDPSWPARDPIKEN